MPEEYQVYYDSDARKFKMYLNQNYVTVGAIHEEIKKVEYKDDIYLSTFDSTFSPNTDPYTPIVSLNKYDSDGNPITWTTQHLTNTNLGILDNVNLINMDTEWIAHVSKGSVANRPSSQTLNPTISKLVGSGNEYTITPVLSRTSGDYDYSEYTEEITNDVYKFTGQIATGSGKSGLPKKSNLDSNYLENSFYFTLEYTPTQAHVTFGNIPDFYDYIGLGAPDVKYKVSSPLRLLTNCQGIVFNDVDSSLSTGNISGKKLFAVNNSSSGRTVDQYNLNNPYGVDSLFSTSTPDKSLGIYNNLGISNSITEAINSSNLFGLDFNDSGTRLFLADKGHNNIYQYDLTNPYELDDSAYYKTDYYENANIQNPVTVSQSANSQIRDYTYVAWFRNFITKWYPTQNIYDNTFTTHLSKDGKHYYIMDANGIKQHDLSHKDQICTANYVGLFSIFESTKRFYWPGGKGGSGGNTREGYGYVRTDSTFSTITQHFREILPEGYSPFPTYRRAAHFNKNSIFILINQVLRVIGYKIQYDFIHSAYPQCFTISADGTKLYILWGCAYDKGQLKQYTLTTPWLISSATPTATVSHGIGQKSPNTDNVTESKLYSCWGIELKPDGSSIFIWDNDTNYVYEFTMSTPYDITTVQNDAGIIQPWSGSYTRRSPQIIASPRLKHFKMNRIGTKFYLSNSSITRQYSMSIPYDVSTATFDVERSTLGVTDVSAGAGFELNQDETTIYLPKTTETQIQSFQLTNSSAANNDSADLNSAVTVQTQKYLNLDAYIPSNRLHDVTLTSDGKQMYVIENRSTTAQKVHRYNLSDSNEIYSAVYDSAFSTLPDYSLITGMALNDSENKMIIVGGPSTKGFVREYTITNPFSSSTFNTHEYLLTGPNNKNMADVHFTPEGDKFITLGNNGMMDVYTTRNKFVIKPI